MEPQSTHGLPPTESLRRVLALESRRRTTARDITDDGREAYAKYPPVLPTAALRMR
jgi:hypothetical protein